MSILKATTSRRRMLFVQSMLVFVLSLWPVARKMASAAAQVEANPILLGEFAHASLAEGEMATYALTIPAAGTYTVVLTGATSPSDFQMSVTDADAPRCTTM